jgi:hypothetical protein
MHGRTSSSLWVSLASLSSSHGGEATRLSGWFQPARIAPSSVRYGLDSREGRQP